MKQFVINTKDSNQRADKYLQRIMPNASKSFLYKMMRKKNIVLNDHKMQGNEILNSNDVIKVWFSDDTFNSMANVSNDSIDIEEYLTAYNKLKDIEVIYEDDDFIILDKPVGILSQKATPKDLSLNEWLIGYLLKNNKIQPADLASVKPSISNRLDRNTCGLVLCGKSLYGLNILSKTIKNRDIKKLYKAYVFGKVEKAKQLSDYLRKDQNTNLVKIIDEEAYNKLSKSEKNDYSNILTAYKPLESSYSQITDRNITLIEVELKTGKTHQIRAHMAHEGFPLIGDNKYGNNSLNKMLKTDHQLLQAYKLVFPKDDSLGTLSNKTFLSKISLALPKEI